MKPRNQVEAMPPFGLVAQPPFPSRTMQPVFNSATCHPVFFAQTLIKPPFPIPHGPGVAGVNPAAFGYIAEIAKKNGMGTKL
jgi:hypothetical protein